MAEFSLTTQSITSTVVVTRLQGDMDDIAFDSIEDEFSKLLDSGVLGVVLDLSGLESVTSAGLGAIINMARILEFRHGRLVAAAPRPGVLGTIEMLGIQDALPLEETADAGRKAVLAVVK